MENVKAMLEAEGLTLDDVAKEPLYITDMRYLERVLEVRNQYYKVPPPSTYVGVNNTDSEEDKGVRRERQGQMGDATTDVSTR